LISFSKYSLMPDQHSFATIPGAWNFETPPDVILVPEEIRAAEEDIDTICSKLITLMIPPTSGPVWDASVIYELKVPGCSDPN
jgi:hypothetical protein